MRRKIIVPKVYIKDQSYNPFYKAVDTGFYFKSKLLSGSLMAVGFLVLGTQVVIPLVFFTTQDSVTAKPLTSSVLGIASGYSEFQFGELQESNAPGLAGGQNTSPGDEKNIPTTFQLSIPKLNIKDAIVDTNSTTLSPDTALGHYKGTALPGQPGNALIYGHSVLPIFYNPKNYRTIFSTLGDLEAGDDVILNYNNKELTYKVESKVQLDPNDVDPLARFKPTYLNESTIELMTCWPAGTKSRRLIVRAVLSTNGN
jgi:sortase A